jgi:peptidoglycan/LPS O-acetylase OafA/YrhL
MTTVLERYKKSSRRRRRRAERNNQRLDIQGLRMVAVLTVFANHLWDWPRGGFVGVDVFFVISGFLITGNLLRNAEKTGTVSFRKFYWNRVRRIVPAATVVLILTYVICLLVFLPFRAHQVGVDALFAFIFMANWHFAIHDTNYFAAADAVSPIQHYWSLSIEEQFYFVWPALIFVISLIVVGKVWNHYHRMLLAGGVMGIIITASLGWAIHETATAPVWAYFNTFARVWELGVGALLATAVGVLARIPDKAKPLLSWAGLGLIAASLFLIGDDSVGFPAPWALMPVAGAALVIAAGVGGEPGYQDFLRNRVSTYIGDFSYSLYLVHWPVIVILAAMMDIGAYFYVSVLALSFGLAIASYHFVENPLRRADWGKFRESVHDIRRRRYRTERSTGYAGVAALALSAVALTAYAARPDAYEQAAPPPLAAVAPAEVDQSGTEPKLGPLASALQIEIVEALKAIEWPQLDPSMEAVISDPTVQHAIQGCYGNDAVTDPAACTWGSSSAPTRVVVVGDSIAANYVVPLREIALNSGGQFQLYTLALGGCEFVNDLIFTADQGRLDACPGRKQGAVDFINTTRPDVVIISNNYLDQRINGTDHIIQPGEWSESMRQIVDKFRGSTTKIVFLAPPPPSPLISECYSERGSTPADCIGRVTSKWLSMAKAEQDLAKSIGGTWVDSRPWVCSSGGLCPSFVGSTPTKLDETHIVPAYGLKIYPVIEESFRDAGVF